MELARSTEETPIDPDPIRRVRLLQDERHAADEILAVFEDGHEERAIVRRASTRRRIRMFEARPGLVSATIARRLTMVEWRAVRYEDPVRRHPRSSPPASVAVAVAAPVAAATGPIPDRSGTFAWEVLIRQHGKTRMMRVAAATEDVAVELMLGLDGVDAAAAIRPMTFDQYREALA